MKDDAKSLLKRFSGFSIGPIISALIGFIIVPITSWFVVPEEFGKVAIYTIALNLSTSIAFFGMDAAFIREYNGKNNKKELLFNCFFVSVSISMIIGIIYIIFSEEISQLLYNSEEKFIMMILAISIPIGIFQGFNKILIRVKERGITFSIIIILERLIHLIMLLLIIKFLDRSFKGIIMAYFIANIITSLITFIINKKDWMSRIHINRKIIKNALKFGLPLVPTMILTWGLSSMDKIALKTWSDFTELGLYSVALRISSMLDIFKTSFVTFWSPIAYRWFENKVDNRKFIIVMNLMTSLICIAFGLVIISKNYIILVFNKEYLDAAKMVPFLLFVPVTEIIVQITGKGIAFSRKTGYYVVTAIIAVVLNFAGNYLLVPIYGGIGATISTGISYIIFFWIRTLVSRKLWFMFDITKQVMCISVMFFMAISSIILNKLIIDIIFFIIILILTKNDMKYIYDLIKKSTVMPMRKFKVD